MAQVLKLEVRNRVVAAALKLFADKGYAAASMQDLADVAGVTASNVYRYFENKAALFDEVVPRRLVQRIEALVRARFVHARGVADLRRLPATGPWRTVAAELAQLAAQHRLELVILLRHGEGTPHAGFRARLHATMVGAALAHFGPRCGPQDRAFLEVVYEQLLSALAAILVAGPDDLGMRVEQYEHYHLAGLRSVMVERA